MILHKARPEFVPVDEFTLLTPPILAVHRVPSEAAIDDSYETADRQAPARSAAAKQDLLERSTKRTARDGYSTPGGGNTYKVLKAAIETGSIDAVEAALSGESDRLAAVDLTHALCTAIDMDRLDVARRLLSAGADPNGYYAWTNSQWESLSHGVDKSGLGEEFGPPLFHAARGGNVAAIELLVKAGSDVDMQLDVMSPIESALDTALCLGYLQAAEALHRHGASIGPQSLIRAIQARRNRRTMVEWTLDHGAAWTVEGHTMLHSAVGKYDPDLLQALLDRGYSDTQPNQFGATALQQAEESFLKLRAKDAGKFEPEWLPNVERIVQILSDHHRRLSG